MTRILVVGGAGVFGSRLVEGLAATTGAEIIVAGRDAARGAAAVTAIRTRHPAARIEALTLDARTVTPAALLSTRAAIVVDAAGPFQGAAPVLAQTAIAAGIHYIDLADARDFVADFPALDAAARAAGVVAITGASSTPALSHAVLDRLTTGWRRIDRVEVGISPGNRAPRGRSVVAAILSWAGRPVRVFDGGGWTSRPGWSGTVTRGIGDLGRRRLALAETPDLDLLAARYRPRDAALFRAGLELRILHDGLALAAWLPRLGLVASLAPLAGPARWLAAALDGFGSDRGGMLVEASGRDRDDRPAIATWSLAAEAGDGPCVPTLPALAVLRRLLEAPETLEPGARPAAGVLDLEAITTEFARLRMRTAVATLHPLAPFEAALAGRFDALPGPVQAAHRGGPVTRLAGTATVEGAATPAGRLVARLVGFPPAGAGVPVRVVKRRQADGTEVWERDFAGRRFSSHLAPLGPGRVEERFGPLTFELALGVDAGRLTIRVAGWRIGPLRLPRRLAPASEASEGVDPDGRFLFDVPIAVPLLGRLVRYRGRLAIEV